MSARYPVYDAQQNVLKVKVDNFGLSASEPADIEIICSGKTVATGRVAVLQPYEEKELPLTVFSQSDTKPTEYEVMLSCQGKELERISFKVSSTDKK